jgi:hypothetical protein
VDHRDRPEPGQEDGKRRAERDALPPGEEGLEDIRILSGLRAESRAVSCDAEQRSNRCRARGTPNTRVRRGEAEHDSSDDRGEKQTGAGSPHRADSSQASPAAQGG